MYKLLIVEDDPGIAEGIKAQTEAWGLEVRTVENFRNVLAEFSEYQPHIVLLDIMLPFFNGYHWCSEIRKISKVPIIFISSASDNMNIVMAMNMGADDFIAKPFDENVLTAKIQALLRRTYDFGSSVPVIEHRGAILNTGDGTLTFGTEQISLSKNEFKILREHYIKKNDVRPVFAEFGKNVAKIFDSANLKSPRFGLSLDSLGDTWVVLNY